MRGPLRSRVLAHATVIFGLWPLETVVAATLEARLSPYYAVSWLQALGAATAGLVLVVPEFLMIGLAVAALSVTLFQRLDSDVGRPRSFHRLCLEPVLLFLVILCGACLWFPGILGQTVFVVLWPLPSILGVAFLVFTAVYLLHDVARRGRRLTVGAAALVVGIVAPLPGVVADILPATDHPRSDVVILGLDSIAQTDNVSILQQWIRAREGAWYEHPVAPGLFTNAVWTSVLTRLPVHDHGVFHTFQQLPRTPAPLITAAKRAGFRTISLFPNQLTCAAGSGAGFDQDLSGPVGWRQLILPIVENSSVLLPLFKPLLPRWPWMAAPPNHAGTFTYSVRRDVREILTSGTAHQRTLVAAHLTYLHEPAYPRTVDLSWRELLTIMRAPAGSLRDRSLDWQDQDRPTDALPLHRWKMASLQHAVVSTIEETRFLQHGGKIVIFSDHGDRAGLTRETFTDERFHRVVLASIGLPTRDLQSPMSLIDIGAIAGVFDSNVVSDPVVEFTIAPSTLWPRLVSTARLQWSGEVQLSAQLLGEVFADLKAYRPAVDSSVAAGE